MNPKVEDDLKPIASMVSIVASVFGFDLADLLSRSRVAEVAEARQVAMYIGWHFQGYTLTTIGQALGGRSAATVSYGYQVIAQRLRTSERLRRKVEKVESIHY